MQRLNAPQMAVDKGALLTSLLHEIPQVVSVRGRGLLLGAELAEGIDAKEVQLQLLKNGLVTNAVTGTALRLAPPLIVTEEEIREAAGIIAAALKGVQS
jgi:acetylornithine/succinyldiaminopimelate/putrescine aminotransferase